MRRGAEGWQVPSAITKYGIMVCRELPLSQVVSSVIEDDMCVSGTEVSILLWN